MGIYTLPKSRSSKPSSVARCHVAGIRQEWTLKLQSRAVEGCFLMPPGCHIPGDPMASGFYPLVI